jgi:histidine triad (HIT) family protein
MPTLFTRIIEGEIPGHFVWRDEQCVAFLSINPITSGHCLVVPRREVDHWLDAEPDLNAHLMQVAQVLGRAQQRAFDAPRIGLLVAGFEVPHCHLHVLPIRGEEDLHLDRSARSVEPSTLVANAQAIRGALRDLGAPGVSD